MTVLPESESPRRRRGIWLAGGIGLVAIAAWWAIAPHTYQTLPEVRAKLRATIPDHAPLSRVLAVLDSLHTTHSGLNSDSTVTANFGESSRQAIVYFEIFGTFRFDGSHTLVSYKLEEIGTGP